MSFISTTNKAKIASPLQFESNMLNVYLSDAEVQVIQNKANKAGISVNEYIRNAALGFPVE